MTSYSHRKQFDTSTLFYIFTIRKKLGFTSWSEVIIALISFYILFNYFIGFIGLYLPYSNFFAVLGLFYAWYQIHLLGSLSERLEQFDMENKRLKESVDTFKIQNSKLKSITEQLGNENKKFECEITYLHSSLKTLQNIKNSLQQYATKNNKDINNIIYSLNNTLEEQKRVVKQQSELLHKTKEATTSQEKILLLQLQAQCQFLDRELGMNPSEFKMFVDMIPTKYKNSPAGLRFDVVDSDADGNISVKEFYNLVDNLLRSISIEEEDNDETIVTVT